MQKLKWPNFEIGWELSRSFGERVTWRLGGFFIGYPNPKQNQHSFCPGLRLPTSKALVFKKIWA
jgi:hypothetical protein